MASENGSIRDTFVIAALRSLFASHPDPSRLRDAWGVEISKLWTLYATHTKGAELDALKSRYSREQALWESWLPPA